MHELRIPITNPTGSHSKRNPIRHLYLRAALVFALCVGSRSHAAEINWGAVGHSNRVTFGPSYSYNKVPIDKQMRLLRMSGLGWYRTSCVASNCDELVQSAHTNGIQILKSSGGTPDPSLSESENYARAYAMGAGDGKFLNSAIKYFEAGNELDNWVGMKGDGSSRSQYNAQRYLQARGYVRGLIDGIHSANASAQVMVDDAGWCHYGFLQMLWQDGVRWDITAFHWYSDQGNFEHTGCGNNANVAAIHAAFGLPLWITEFNSKAAASSNDSLAEGNYIAAFVTQVHSVATKYGIQGAFVYELLDEPNLSGTESHFGIFDGSGNPKGPSAVIFSVLKSFASVVPNPPQNIEVH